MKDWLKENGLTVLEEPRFRKRVTDPETGIFTIDQYYNRMSYRTKLSAAEKKVLNNILAEIRK